MRAWRRTSGFRHHPDFRNRPIAEVHEVREWTGRHCQTKRERLEYSRFCGVFGDVGAAKSRVESVAARHQSASPAKHILGLPVSLTVPLDKLGFSINSGERRSIVCFECAQPRPERAPSFAEIRMFTCRRLVVLASAAALVFAAQAQAQAQGPTARVGAPRPFSQLSVQERGQLPASTPVVVGHATTTLGALRASHAARVLRISQRSALTNAAASIVSTGSDVIEPKSAYDAAPRDMKTFCDAQHAAVCLYFPAGAHLNFYEGVGEDFDGYMTDHNLCVSEGGVVREPGCQFNYPYKQVTQFDPGTKGPFTHTEDCDPKYWKALKIDPHGVVAYASTHTEGLYVGDLVIGDAPSICVVRVKLAK